MTLSIIAPLILGYLLGSIPFGFLLTKLAGASDIREIGSGNIGATNVLRTGRKGLAAATLLGDILKGTSAVLIAAALWDHTAGVIAGFGAFFGHVFPVWLRFKGGKGVATYIGVLLALAWPAAIVFCAVWAVTAAVTRYSSLSGLIASFATICYLAWQGVNDITLLFFVLTQALWLTHRANIARLYAGTEGKIGRQPRPE